MADQPLQETERRSKHDEACLARRRTGIAWRYLCTCGQTDAEVKAGLQCDSCDELPPRFPFPNCKCFE